MTRRSGRHMPLVFTGLFAALPSSITAATWSYGSQPEDGERTAGGDA